MAIISSVLKLVNVGGAVNIDDEGKDKKEEESIVSSDPVCEVSLKNSSVRFYVMKMNSFIIISYLDKIFFYMC